MEFVKNFQLLLYSLQAQKLEKKHATLLPEIVQ